MLRIYSLSTVDTCSCPDSLQTMSFKSQVSFAEYRLFYTALLQKCLQSIDCRHMQPLHTHIDYVLSLQTVDTCSCLDSLQTMSIVYRLQTHAVVLTVYRYIYIYIYIEQTIRHSLQTVDTCSCLDSLQTMSNSLQTVSCHT